MKETFQIFITSKFSFLSKLCRCHIEHVQCWTQTFTFAKGTAAAVRPGAWVSPVCGVTLWLEPVGSLCHSLQWVGVPATVLGACPEKHPQRLQGEGEPQCQWLQQVPRSQPTCLIPPAGGRSICASSKSCVWSVF